MSSVKYPIKFIPNTPEATPSDTNQERPVDDKSRYYPAQAGQRTLDMKKRLEMLPAGTLPSQQCTDLVQIPDEVGLAARTNFLVGKTVKGVLMQRRGGYFIKWNGEIADGVYLGQSTVERCLPELRPGLIAIVKCTITKLGPASAHWTKQHPMSKEIEIVSVHYDHEQSVPKSVQGFSARIPAVNSPPMERAFTDRVRQKANETRPRFFNSRTARGPNLVPMAHLNRHRKVSSLTL